MSETITEKAKDAVGGLTSNGDSLAKRLLIPAAAGVGTLAATYGASKAPSLLGNKLMPLIEDRSSDELAEVGQQAASKLGGGGGAGGAIASVAGKALSKGGGGGAGRKKTRRLPIQRWTDVAVPVET